MSGSLKRALALWAASQVDGLHVYADDLANVKHRYPCCTVIELTHGVEPLGCGKRDFITRRADNGFVATVGKLHRSEETFRLTVSSPSEAERHGQEIVDAILQSLEVSALAAWLSADPMEWIDRGSDPPVSFRLESVKPLGRQSIPPDITGEPFLYRGALTLSLRRMLPIERAVEHVMERIHLSKEKR